MLERIGAVAYRLALLVSAAIHPVFHVFHLKKVIGEHSTAHPFILYISENHEWMALPEEVYQKNPTTENWEVLISWKGLPPHEATWENCDEFQHQCPDFHLEDKVVLEECNVRLPIILQYSRRKKKWNSKEKKENAKVKG